MQVHHCKTKIDVDRLAGLKLGEDHFDVVLGGDEPFFPRGVDGLDSLEASEPWHVLYEPEHYRSFHVRFLSR